MLATVAPGVIDFPKQTRRRSGAKNDADPSKNN
jgi:hypothetical protein